MGGANIVDVLGIEMCGLAVGLGVGTFGGNPRGDGAAAIDAEGGGVGRGGADR